MPTYKPEYPIFVPTKNRFNTPYTIRALHRLGLQFNVVVEKSEYDAYKKVVPDDCTILVLPFENRGLRDTRNWIWDYAEHELGAEYYWTFDDNIRRFFYYTRNRKYRLKTPGFLKAIEDFGQRYENLIITGMQYDYFVPRRNKVAPLTLNTRVYSNMFIQTRAGYRFQTFYNDDTDICLRILKDRKCVCMFNVFQAQKISTMVVSGGMTDYYKQTNKRLEFAKELKAAHPDVTSIVWKWNRWHHEVDYSRFRKNRLKLREGVVIPDEPVDYGIKLIELDGVKKNRPKLQK